MADTIRSKPISFLVLYIVYVLILTLHPFSFSGSSLRRVTEFLGEFLTVSSRAARAAGTKDFVQNIVFFIPFGALLYCCLKSPQKSGGVILFVGLIAGGALSLLIEVSQIFLGRHSAVSDVIANSLGTGSGALIVAMLPGPARLGLVRWSDKLQRSRAFLCCILIFGTAPLIFTLSQLPRPNFRSWDSRFPFQLANEATLDRPWLGRIHLVAVYNRALTAAEIANNFRLGFSTDARERRTKNGLVALYTFTTHGGGMVRDVSGVGPPLDLLIEPQANVSWLSSSNGIEITRPAILKSESPAKKLANAFRGSDEISVEAWFAPANLIQKGPARIVSYSGGSARQNFTLGQHGADVVFRLQSGSAQPIETDDQVLKLDPTHIVSTYGGGIARIYVNGVQHPNMIHVTRDVIIGFGAKKTLFAQIGYSFFYFFPVALFVAVFLSSKYGASISAFIAGVAAGLGLLSMTDVFQAIAFDRAIDFRFIGCGLAIVAAGSLIGLSVSRTAVR